MYFLHLMVFIMAISPLYASNFSVTFTVVAPKETENIFIVGSSPELGNS